MKFALITGASRGIGKALAFELARRGYSLLLTARSESLLGEIAQEIGSSYKVQVEIFPGDLSQRTFPDKLLNWVTENNFPVSVLINNAGYGIWGYFDELSLQEQLEMLHLNQTAMVALTHHLLPILRKNAPAYIMNVASTTAYQAVPGMSVYAASKSFVIQFTRGLRHELKDSPVSVSCLSPGSTDTSFPDRANMDERLKKLADKFGMSPDKVAKIALKKMFRGKAEIIPGFTNWFSVMGVKFLPKRMIENIAANIYLKTLKRK